MTRVDEKTDRYGYAIVEFNIYLSLEASEEARITLLTYFSNPTDTLRKAILGFRSQGLEIQFAKRKLSYA